MAVKQSLGLPRYIMLTEGRGGPDGHWLLDLKFAAPSTLARHAPCKQPAWKAEGERVVAVQKTMVAMAPALLSPVLLHGESFVLKELQPTADRLDLAATRGDLTTFTEVIEDMAQLTAWAQLRGCARYGAAMPDELMRFGVAGKWQAPMLQAARIAAERNLEQWQMFRQEHLQRTLQDGETKKADQETGEKSRRGKRPHAKAPPRRKSRNADPPQALVPGDATRHPALAPLPLRHRAESAEPVADAQEAQRAPAHRMAHRIELVLGVEDQGDIAGVRGDGLDLERGVQHLQNVRGVSFQQVGHDAVSGSHNTPAADGAIHHRDLLCDVCHALPPSNLSANVTTPRTGITPSRLSRPP